VKYLFIVPICTKQQIQPKNPYIDIEADYEEEDEDADDDLFDDEEMEGEDGPSVPSPKVTRLPGPSAQDKFTAEIDVIFNRYKEVRPISSSEGPRPYRVARSSGAIENRMYLLRVQSMSIFNHAKYHSLHHRNGHEIYH
jgi:hypothetical protein